MADTSKIDESYPVDEKGVDLTLVRHSLRMTPSERLKSVENFMRAMATVRRPEPVSR